MKRQCAECGARVMGFGPQKVSVEVGPRTFDAEVTGSKCRACGEVYYDGPDLEALDLIIAEWLANHGFVTGAEFRFMRKAIGLRALDLAELLGVTPETVSHWENDKYEPGAGVRATLGSLVLDAKAGKRATIERLDALRKPPKAKRVVLKNVA